MENAWLEAGQEDLSAAWAEAATGNQYEMAAGHYIRHAHANTKIMKP